MAEGDQVEFRLVRFDNVERSAKRIVDAQVALLREARAIEGVVKSIGAMDLKGQIRGRLTETLRRVTGG